jgi:hypothetical protein
MAGAPERTAELNTPAFFRVYQLTVLKGSHAVKVAERTDPDLTPFLNWEIRVSHKDVYARLFDHPKDLANNIGSPTEARRKHTGGRKATYDWLAIEQETDRLMDHHDDFSDDDPEWNKQAQLEKALLDFCQRTDRRVPDVSLLRKKNRIPQWLANWRERKGSRKPAVQN